MEIEFDPFKRTMTLAERGLDMARAGEIFDANHLTVQDERKDLGGIVSFPSDFSMAEWF